MFLFLLTLNQSKNAHTTSGRLCRLSRLRCFVFWCSRCFWGATVRSKVGLILANTNCRLWQRRHGLWTYNRQSEYLDIRTATLTSSVIMHVQLKIAKLLICQLVVILIFTVRVSHGVEISSTFKVFNNSKIPTAGFWQILSIASSSVKRCSAKCNSLSKSDWCGGFLYQPDSCSGINGSSTISGVCKLVQFIEINLVTFGPTQKSCHKFYILAAPVTPGKWLSRSSSLCLLILEKIFV